MSSNGQLVDTSVIDELARLLKARGWKLGTAESCTGGGIGWALTSVPGSSEWYEGGLVTYSNAMKDNLLGVSPDLLAQYGAVSEQCAVAMAEGALQALRCDFALSVTGIAGPDGGSKEKPVGTVYFGWASQQKTTVQRCIFDGSRDSVRRQSVIFSVTQAIEYMNNS